MDTAGLKVPTGDAAQGIRRCQHGQTECEGNSSETDAQLVEASGHDRAAATGKRQPERAYELRGPLFRSAVSHMFFLVSFSRPRHRIYRKVKVLKAIGYQKGRLNALDMCRSKTNQVSSIITLRCDERLHKPKKASQEF